MLKVNNLIVITSLFFFVSSTYAEMPRIHTIKRDIRRIERTTDVEKKKKSAKGARLNAKFNNNNGVIIYNGEIFGKQERIRGDTEGLRIQEVKKNKNLSKKTTSKSVSQKLFTSKLIISDKDTVIQKAEVPENVEINQFIFTERFVVKEPFH